MTHSLQVSTHSASGNTRSMDTSNCSENRILRVNRITKVTWSPTWSWINCYGHRMDPLQGLRTRYQNTRAVIQGGEDINSCRIQFSDDAKWVRGLVWCCKWRISDIKISVLYTVDIYGVPTACILFVKCDRRYHLIALIIIDQRCYNRGCVRFMHWSRAKWDCR